MSPEYLAGFFDGEGCIDVQRMYPSEANARKRFYCRPRVRVAQAESGRLIIDQLVAAFGGHTTSRASGGNNQQPSVSWEVLNKDSMCRILELLIPHLVIKKEQAKLALWWLLNMSGKRSDVFPHIEAARELFAAELKLMKLDPQRLSEEAVSRIEALMR